MAKREMHFPFFVSIVDKNYGAHSAFLKCSLSAANYKGLMSARSVLQHLHCVHKTILVLFSFSTNQKIFQLQDVDGIKYFQGHFLKKYHQDLSKIWVPCDRKIEISLI